MTRTTISITNVLLQDLWMHMAALFALMVGLVDLWAFRQLSHDTELLLMVGGFAGMGLKIVNGSAAALREVALDTAWSAARAAQAAGAPGPPPSNTAPGA